MFFKKSHFDEVADTLKHILETRTQAPAKERNDKQNAVIQHLIAAGNILDDLDLVNYGAHVTNYIGTVVEAFDGQSTHSDKGVTDDEVEI